MKRMTAAAGILILALAGANATTIDLSTRTCKQFQASGDEEIKLILTWLDGYYREETAPAIIDTDRFVDNAKKLGEFCRANPDIGLITAADKLFK